MVLPWTRLVDLLAHTLRACTEGERVEVETMVRVGVGIRGRRWLSGAFFCRLVWTSLQTSREIAGATETFDYWFPDPDN